jgi:hypothetical protein
VQSIRTNVNASDAYDELSSAIGRTAAQITSLVDTTVMGIDRLASTTQSTEAGFTLFLYDGPVDSLTRPFCMARVGKVMTLEELDSEDNDTGPNPPSVYCGGYNCRHRLVPKTEEEAKDYPRWKG